MFAFGPSSRALVRLCIKFVLKSNGYLADSDFGLKHYEWIVNAADRNLYRGLFVICWQSGHNRADLGIWRHAMEKSLVRPKSTLINSAPACVGPKSGSIWPKSDGCRVYNLRVYFSVIDAECETIIGFGCEWNERIRDSRQTIGRNPFSVGMFEFAESRAIT